ncbi:hypothetical protein BJF79_08745 [Actinomadura sp. CNU-125]|uniref:superinfection immunity protein n=1 Tax=Actinomadura sp. CNU-125 TaxID=1904961 RepID=UPI00096835F4|nr:superinfection immunity protein [Actinomadura sp. CNU-125]OLT31872.1 hypothetical protein BJF79_08745 [Actinomadura sp. CNU-125]
MTTGINPDWLLGLALITTLVFLAVLPTLIAVLRGADELMLIVLVNALCCATVLGWPLAVIMAIKWPRKYPRPPRAPRVQKRLRARGHQQEPYV